ncbi:MAG: hypothetical protein M3256_09920, partial [Actinomycetota bacterium]|nr:hypothetical protein [Actinomycetota bacterium]
MDLSGVVTGLANLLGSVTNPDRRQRRLWVSDGRAHIEVRGLHHFDAEELRDKVGAALEALEGVHWAQVNAITGRVAVVFDGEALSGEDLLGVVEGIEEAHETGDERFPADRPEFPGDAEPLHRNVAALAADVVGLGASVFGQLLEATPIPAELASLVTLIDSTPRVRRVLETHFGHPVTDFSLAMANALAQALGQGPAGLLVDIGNRLSQISEIQARQAVWAEREAELAQHHHGPVTALVPVPRPVPLPAGPIERYTDQASLASLAAFGVTWAVTGSARAGTTALMAGLPKAARVGREAFASQAGRVLADRGVVVLDPGVLRRLDRIDTVVLDVDVVTTGCWCLGEAVGMGPLAGPEVLRQAQAIFDPEEPERRSRRGPWTLGLLDDLGTALPRGARTRARTLAETRTPVLGLARNDVLVGLVSVVAEFDPLAEALSRAVLVDGHLLVIAGTRGGVARRLGAGRTVAGGHRMDDAVRALQEEGRAVAVVGRQSAALRAADCGIGLLADDEAPPWGADVVCGPGLAAACLIVEAFALARRTSRASASLALTGSAVGATWAFVGSPVGAGKRALLPVNGAAMLALGAGAWTGAALARRPAPVAAASVAWRELDLADVLARLGSSEAGLQTADARRRLAAAEAAPPAGGPPSLAQAVLAELATPLTPVLAVGAALSAAVGSLTDAWLVGGVVGANALVSAAERLRTERALQRLMTSAAIRVRVRRDDTVDELASNEVVTGDVLTLAAGEVVAADCRILDAASLEVDESALTGESLPVSKAPGICAGAAVAERSCMLYEGTTVVAGTASAVVVAVGRAT